MAPAGDVVRAGAAFLSIGAGLGVVAHRVVELQLGLPEAAGEVRALSTVSAVDVPQRGRIVARDGTVLAEDQPLFEVRAEIEVDLDLPDDAPVFAALRQRLAADLAFHLAYGLEGRRSLSEQVATRDRLLHRMARATRPERDVVLRPASAGRPARVRRKLDFLVDPAVLSAVVLEGLRSLERTPDWRRLRLHFLKRHRRVYPAGDAFAGPVGFVFARGESDELRTGVEALDALRRVLAGSREILRDVDRRRFWAGYGVPGGAPSVVHLTLSPDLQRAAQAELEKAVAGAAAQFGSPPEWAALVLADVSSGDVLAMASFVDAAEARAAAFAPTQRVFQPGSSVKPLVFSIAMQHGLLAWEDDRFDCTAGGTAEGWAVTVPGGEPTRVRRMIKDDHPCGVLSPLQILQQSSNVGAVKVGQRLDPRLMQEYLDRYRFSAKTAIGLWGERTGRRPRDLAKMPRREFDYFTGPSLSFGYELSVTPLQMLRAYLSLLSGRERELRLVHAVEVDGERRELPAKAAADPFLRPDVVDLLRAAMVAVVSEQPGATGRYLAEELRQIGIPEGAIGGKSGTSVHDLRNGKKERTASFAGFAPAAAPRYVAFCVMQKVSAEGFYGGRYAASPAGRLLLRALDLLPRSTEEPAGVRQVSVEQPRTSRRALQTDR
jgi:cell division protein FtsI (penicillin-binding protein 3)